MTGDTRRRKGKAGAGPAAAAAAGNKNKGNKNKGNKGKKAQKGGASVSGSRAWSDHPGFYDVLPEAFTHLMLAIVGFLLYINSIQAQYVLADAGYIMDNPDVRLPSRSWTDLLTHDAEGAPIAASTSSAPWTPLTTASFKLHWRHLGPAPDVMHLVNAVLYAFAGPLFFAVAKVFSRAHHATAFTATLFFLFSPLHSEAVAHLAARSHLLSSLFVLLALRAYAAATRDPALHLATPAKARPSAFSLPSYFVFLLAAAAAVLSRDSGIVVLPLVVAYDLIVYGPGNAGAVARSVFHAAATAGAFMARSTLLGLPLLPAGPSAVLSNPLATAPHSLSKALSIANIASKAATLMAQPFNLSCDYSHPTLAPVVTLADPRNFRSGLIFGLLLLGTFFVLIRSAPTFKTQFLLSQALLWGSYLPFSHLLFPAGTPLEEASLFLPSAGMALLLGTLFVAAQAAFARASRSSSELGRIVMVVAVGMMAVATVSRNAQWLDEPSIVNASLESTPFSARLSLLHARVSMAQDNYELALKDMDRALALFEDYCAVHVAKGDALMVFKSDAHSALHEYRKAVSCAAEADPEPSVVLSHALVEQGMLAEAQQVSARALEIWPNNTHVHWSMGHSVVAEGRLDEASKHFTQAILLDEANLDALFSMSRIYLDDDHYQPAMAYLFLQQVLLLDPSHDEARSLYKHAQFGAQAAAAASIEAQAQAQAAGGAAAAASQAEEDDEEEDEEDLVLDEEVFNSNLPPMPNDEEGFHSRVKSLRQSSNKDN